MMFPTIHLNGSSAENLEQDAYKASRAVGDAIAVLEQNPPNGRDYYPQGAAAHQTAMAEHLSRITRLKVVQDELNEITNHIWEEQSARQLR